MDKIDQVKKLREETGISLMECKKACEEAGGDVNIAREILRKKGQSIAAKRSDRQTGEGIITSYIHQNNKIGVILDIRCESDFVARSDDFRDLSREICLQIAAMGPIFVSSDNIPTEVLEKEREINREQFKNSGKPSDIIEKIVEGKVNSYIKETCLLFQSWIKDDTKNINDLINEKIAKTGEKIVVNRFTRYEI